MRGLSAEHERGNRLSSSAAIDWKRWVALRAIDRLEQHVRSGTDWIDASSAAGVSPLQLARAGVDLDLLLGGLIRAGEERARAAEGEALRTFREGSRSVFALEALSGEDLPVGRFRYPPPSRSAVHLLWALHELLGERRAPPPGTRGNVHDEFAALVSGLDVVELGCGPGRLMALLERLGARCIGFDPAPVAPIQSQLRIHARPATDLPLVLPLASADIIVSNNTLCAAVLDRKVAIECVKAAELCLRPGGLQLHTVWMQPLLPGHEELLEWRALREEGASDAEIDAALDILREGRWAYVNEPVLTDDDLADLSASRVICHRVRDGALIIALERRG